MRIDSQRARLLYLAKEKTVLQESIDGACRAGTYMEQPSKRSLFLVIFGLFICCLFCLSNNYARC